MQVENGVFSRSGFPVEPLPAGSVAVCCSSLRMSESQNYCQDRTSTLGFSHPQENMANLNLKIRGSIAPVI